jgi:AraC-like DNA-binding protein
LQLVALFTLRTQATDALARGGLAPRQQHRVDQYIREHQDRSMLVEQLAKYLSLGTSYFCRAFKE